MKQIFVIKSCCCLIACANANKFDDLEHNYRVTDGTIWIFMFFFSFFSLLGQGQPDAMQSREHTQARTLFSCSFDKFIHNVCSRALIHIYLLARVVAVNIHRSQPRLNFCVYVFHKVIVYKTCFFLLWRVRSIKCLVHLLDDHT
jgi:hypothetical protein